MLKILMTTGVDAMYSFAPASTFQTWPMKKIKCNGKSLKLPPKHNCWESHVSFECTWWAHIPLLCCPFPSFCPTSSTISPLFVNWELSFQLKGQGPLQGGATKKDCEEVELVGNLVENIQKVFHQGKKGWKNRPPHVIASQVFSVSPHFHSRWRVGEGGREGRYVSMFVTPQSELPRCKAVTFIITIIQFVVRIHLLNLTILDHWEEYGILAVFIGPRCPWGPIYGSGSLSLTDWLTEEPCCRLNWCDSGWWR